MNAESQVIHESVMLEETMQALAVESGGRYIDCTVDGGGHAEAILEHSSPGGQLLGLDADPDILTQARMRLKWFGKSVLLVNANFVNLQGIAIKYDFFPVHGILFDLGLSTPQLSESGRGFSFQHDAPLDMRFSPKQEVTAADLVNQSSENELAHLIRAYGEEGFSSQIAHRIIKTRPIHTTFELGRVIEEAVGGRRGKIHPATKTFQALRIAVNEELKNLQSALEQAVQLLGHDGRIVVISYHSLEDRIVKRFLQREAKGCVCPLGVPVCICGHKPGLRLINRNVVVASAEEVRRNPRSRSARLRAAERILPGDDCQEAFAEPYLLMGNDGGGWRRPSLLKKIRHIYSLT